MGILTLVPIPVEPQSLHSFKWGRWSQTPAAILRRAEGLGPRPASGSAPSAHVSQGRTAEDWGRGGGEWAAGPICTWAGERAGPCRPPSPSSMAHIRKLRPESSKALLRSQSKPGAAEAGWWELLRTELWPQWAPLGSPTALSDPLCEVANSGFLGSGPRGQIPQVFSFNNLLFMKMFLRREVRQP